MINNDFSNLKKFRIDGRNDNENRNIKFDINLKNYYNYNGSCHYKNGLTEVLVLVEGPKKKEYKNSNTVKIIYNNTNFSFNTRKNNDKIQKEWLNFSENLRECIEYNLIKEHYLNSQITITINVLQSNGSLKSAIINCVSLALIDSGIYIKDILIASTCCKINDKIVVDYNQHEENNGNNFIFMAIYLNSKNIAMLESDKLKLEVENIDQYINIISQNCVSLSNAIKSNLKENFIAKRINNL